MQTYVISNISKYRADIMGFAIIGVMLAHVKTICGFPDVWWNKILGLICYSVFTGGFVFLSGLGLYSSLSHNGNLKQFYMKRIKRVLIPYWLITTPFFLYTDLYLNYSVVDFVEHFTTVYFWLHGNYCGMWYIAMTVLLYAIYPLIHYTLFYCQSYVEWRFLIVTSIVVLGISCIRLYLPDFYEMTSVALDNCGFFILGSYTMYVISATSVNSQEKSHTKIITYTFCGASILINTLSISSLWVFINFVSVLIVAFVFAYTNMLYKNVNAFFKWMGTYSLEIYIIHIIVYYFLNIIDHFHWGGYHILIGVFVALVFCKPVNAMANYLTNKQ